MFLVSDSDSRCGRRLTAVLDPHAGVVEVKCNLDAEFFLRCIAELDIDPREKRVSLSRVAVIEFGVGCDFEQPLEQAHQFMHGTHPDMYHKTSYIFPIVQRCFGPDWIVSMPARPGDIEEKHLCLFDSSFRGDHPCGLLERDSCASEAGASGRVQVVARRLDNGPDGPALAEAAKV